MQLILLSGGSGTRLWPLSNDARSKQFLKLLPKDGSDQRESMIQRVIRQLDESGISADVTVATSKSQHESVMAQIGEAVDIVTEPSRRDTFPAICLACEYLHLVRNCTPEEVVVVMPCDPYTQSGYFDTVSKMAECVRNSGYEIIVMGIKPTYPSAKYGYIVPDYSEDYNSPVTVKRFIEKPDVTTAHKLISEGALWNGGVFAFRLGYILDIARRYVNFGSYEDYYDHYGDFPKISFDYEVVERAESIGMIEYVGEWKDLGTWNTLTDELPEEPLGNVITDESSENTHIINELGIPLLCLGTNNLIIAASPDGIIVSEKSKSENIKKYASELKQRPMYEERRWGSYRVIDFSKFNDEFCTLTKRLTLIPGSVISYQYHRNRDEVWTFLDGEGEIVLNGLKRSVRRGDTICIHKGQFHAVKAITQLSFIETQYGINLKEEDTEYSDYDWNEDIK